LKTLFLFLIAKYFDHSWANFGSVLPMKIILMSYPMRLRVKLFRHMFAWWQAMVQA